MPFQLSMSRFKDMKRAYIIGSFIVILTLGVLFDAGAFSRYPHFSVIGKVRCELFFPDKDYRMMGDDANMSEKMGAYWCMSEKDLEEWRARG